MNYSEHHYRSSDGLDLYYRSYGSARDTVVCLPGLTRNCKDFEKLALHLAASRTVITPDLRGRGQSARDPKPSRYHPGTYVRDIWTLLDNLKLDRVIVIGTSLGGLIAMHMADQQPQRLRGVVINDIGPEVPAAAVLRISQSAARTPATDSWESAAEQVKRVYGLAFPAMDDEWWLNFTRLSYRMNDEGLVEQDVDPAVGDAARKAVRAMTMLLRLRKWRLLRRVAGINIDAWDAFRSVTMPCLLVQGAYSDVLTADIVERMRKAKPDLKVVIIPDRGHAPILDEPMARDAIVNFLDGLKKP